MTVTSTNSLQSLASTTSGIAASKTSADFNMFLKMLTTQMQNQDPLDPMDTSEYTQQLVQYSQVEQTIQQNTTLKSILARLDTQNLTQSSGFIGREAEFRSPVSGLSGDQPASWRYAAARPVTSLVASITNAQGKVVATRVLDPAAMKGTLDWNGALPNGNRAPDGPYQLIINGTDANGTTVPVTVGAAGVVREVMVEPDGLKLVVNGVALPAADLVRIAAPRS